MKQIKNSFRLLLTNANGLSNKLGEFQHCLLHHAVDVAIVTETKFSDQTQLADVTFPGYSLPIRRDRDALGGGVSVWVKSNLAVVHHDTIPTDGHEIVWISVGAKPEERFVLGAVYRPGSCRESDTSLFEYLDNVADEVRGLGSHMVLAGDFNVHNSAWLGSRKTTTAGEALEEFSVLHHLQQHVQEPTRGQNTLDLVLSDLPCEAAVRLHPPLGRSDHAVITCDFPLGKTREGQTSRRVWRYQKADWGRLKAFFRSTDWKEMAHPDVSADQLCTQVTGRILEGMENFIPTKVLTCKPSDPKWWTPECQQAISAKEKAWRLWRRHGASQTLKTAFIQSINHAINVQWRARFLWEQRIRTNLSSGRLKDKQWWSTLKAASGEIRTSSIPTLIDGTGQEYSSNREKANCLGRYFAEKCSLGGDDLTQGTLPPIPAHNGPSLNRVHFRPSTVRRLLGQLDVSKATGPDDISARVLKECSRELAEPLTLLFSLSFRTGVQPRQWKNASVVPIHKKSSRSSPTNYRPVSLLSVISKVMERVVNCQLVNHLERNQMLSTKQFGFRRGLGTADLLTVLQHQWSLAVGSGGCAHILALDIAGAFDKVSHPGLIHKVASTGVGGTLLRWIGDYLNKRTLSVVVNGQRSSPFQVRAGVPQGSILGPTLFLIYINDAEACLFGRAEMGIYADDTTMYSLIRARNEVADAHADLQTSLNRLHDWGRRWRIRFEPAKSQLLHVALHRQPWPLPEISFGEQTISLSGEVKLLGVTFDSKLSFRSHVRSIALRATARLGFLRRASKFLDRRSQLATYRGFVRPILEYAPLVWMAAATSHLHQLQRVQRRALHILGPNVLVQSLPARRMVYAITYLYKLMCLDGPPSLRALVPPTHDHGTNPRTRKQCHDHHDYQLQDVLPPGAPDMLRRSFPHGIVSEWNSLPRSVLSSKPTLKSLQTFKVKVHKYLRQRDWLWATDSL